MLLWSANIECGRKRWRDVVAQSKRGQALAKTIRSSDTGKGSFGVVPREAWVPQNLGHVEAGRLLSNHHVWIKMPQASVKSNFPPDHPFARLVPTDAPENIFCADIFRINGRHWMIRGTGEITRLESPPQVTTPTQCVRQIRLLLCGLVKRGGPEAIQARCRLTRLSNLSAGDCGNSM
jgi:hypothetical protein